MNTKQFKYGDLVYSPRGEAAHYIAKAINHGHVVQPIYEGHDSDGAPYDLAYDPMTWEHVFEEPPVEKFHAELGELHQKIAEAQAKLSDLTRDISGAEYEHKQRVKKLATYDALRRIEDYLDGKITHYVHANDYGTCEIIPIEKAMCHSDRYKPRLLALYGDKERGVEWHLHHYSDSSGSMSAGFWMPASSLEEAQGIMQKFIESQIAKYQRPGYAGGYLTSWVRAAVRYGVHVAPELVEKAKQEEAAGNQRVLESRQRDFDIAKKNLQEAQAKVSA